MGAAAISHSPQQWASIAMNILQVPPRMRRREGAREWRAGAVTLRGRRECSQRRDDREDRRRMIANIYSMFEY